MNVIDLAFPIVGQRVPRDHGYALYSALCRRLPGLHGAPWLAVHPIGGTPANGALLLRRDSRLRLRVPTDHIPDVLPLAGTSLDLAGASLRVGAPSVHPLAPAANLDARLVVLTLTRPPRKENAEVGRNTHDVSAIAERYEKELRRQLERIGVSGGELTLCGRHAMTVARARLIGYSVRLSNLDADSSLRVQERGLGGRRAMGCGVFRPTRGRRGHTAES